MEQLIQNKPEKEKLAFVGDGINDAPVLRRADIGIAMGAMGSDAAIEAADVVLMDDDPLQISKAIKISRKSHILVMSNVTIVIYRDTAAFLSSVLKCIKSVIGRSCTITVRIINGEYTTFFTDSVVILHNLYPLLKYALY